MHHVFLKYYLPAKQMILKIYLIYKKTVVAGGFKIEEG